ncbi:hypothetical protein EVAR_56258_1 [Eumeta japonica]|uniref:Uncharacterized protein n=1 Tax=Eumeta variegata TaxID=151549 RepID=A0A4C1XI21_EUMVA|nr:hypothetical protein EVAR_56258_1 [Eumeta japonica]
MYRQRRLAWPREIAGSRKRTTQHLDAARLHYAVISRSTILETTHLGVRRPAGGAGVDYHDNLALSPASAVNEARRVLEFFHLSSFASR